MEWIESIDELEYNIREKLEHKLMGCAICNATGIKEEITSEEINKILKEPKHCSGFSKTTDGYFSEAEGDPTWVCPKCYKRERTRVKYWKELAELSEMQDQMMNAIDKAETKIINASMFEDNSYEEYARVLTFTKNKIKFSLYISGDEIHFQDKDKC